MENHIARVTYGSNDQGGIMGDVFIQERALNDATREGHMFSLQLSHQNQLRSYFIDELRNITIFQRPEQSLGDYVATLPTPIETFRVPTRKYYRGVENEPGDFT